MKNLRGIDLNLMTVFEAVYEERSQSAAARRLGMSQPAVSAALARLRITLGDNLFESSPSGLTTPTSRGHDFYRHIHQALRSIRTGLVNPNSFDPATSQRLFTATMGYGGGLLWGIPLYRRLRQQAPGVRLAIRGVDPFEEIPRLLANQTLDVALHHRRFDDVMLDQRLLARTEFVVIARQDHPRIHAESGLEEILAEEFVGVSQYGAESSITEFLEFLEMYQSRVTLQIPNAIALPLVVNNSELLALTTRRMAQCFGDRLTLQILPLNVPGAVGEAYLMWHRSMEPDPTHSWLREQIAGIIPAVKQSTPIY
jgi:DNA-binding transcriptional LysR family regulator